MTEKDIQKALDKYYIKLSDFVVHNIYCFRCSPNESDTLVINRNGYAVEMEIKVSRSDFFADFKKKRHKIYGELSHTHIPNKFFYVVPEDLIKIEEVPNYAGLIYVTKNGRLKKIKEAKFLHKSIIDLKPILCTKFYGSYLELNTFKENNGVQFLKRENAAKEKRIEEKDKQIWNLNLTIRDLISEARRK